MRKSKGSLIWAYLSMSLVYVSIGLGSAALTLLSEAPKSRAWIVYLGVFLLGAVLIDVRVKSEPVSEEDFE